jgi:hypothetical protein
VNKERHDCLLLCILVRTLKLGFFYFEQTQNVLLLTFYWQTVKVINPFLILVKLKVNSHSESEMILNSYNFQIVLEQSISDEGKTREL